jgi:hypothetical protein
MGAVHVLPACKKIRETIPGFTRSLSLRVERRGPERVGVNLL